MALSLAAMTALAGGASALRGVATGASTIAQSRAAFDKEDEKRKRELEELERTGDLGITEQQRAGIRGEGASQRGALLRQQEAQSARSAAMQPTLTGRDIFLREQAAAQTAEGAESAIRQMETEADMAAEAAQRGEIAALRQAQKARRAGVATGALQMLGGAAEGAGTALSQAQSMKFQAEMQAAQLEKDMSDAEVLQQYLRAQGIKGGYSNRAPRSK